MELTVYLFFNGNCEEAMNFYKEALGGNIGMISRYSEAPMPTTPENKDRIMHGVVEASNIRLLLSDCPAEQPTKFGDNISVSLGFKSDEEMARAFEGLSAGGKVTMPLQDTFWNAKFGMCKDRFGVNWMFNFDKPQDANA